MKRFAGCAQSIETLLKNIENFMQIQKYSFHIVLKLKLNQTYRIKGTG